MVVILMMVIGIVVDNNAWLYAALGLSVLSQLIKSVQAQKELVSAQAQKEQAALDFLKMLQSKMN